MRARAAVRASTDAAAGFGIVATVLAASAGLVMLFAAGARRPEGDRLRLHVAPAGNDKNPGTETEPFATLSRALEAAAGIRRDSGPAVTIELAGGEYPLRESLRLGPEVSGSAGAPTIIEARSGAPARIVGGVETGPFAPVSDPAVIERLDPAARPHVVQADLASRGIDDFGEFRQRGFGRMIAPAPMVLFFDGRPMTVARWPNDGWAEIAGVPAGQDGGLFAYAGDRPRRWREPESVWLHGYWTWDWADSFERVAAIDPERRTIATEPPHGAYGYTAGKRFYAFNILDELDAPGEYFVDRAAGRLYFWPPEAAAGARSIVSMLEDPLLVIDRASHVIVQGLVLECTRGAAVEIVGGRGNVVRGCEIRNVGTVGVCVGRLESSLGEKLYGDTLYAGEGGVENGVDGCLIHACGEGGVMIHGGDRRTLEPGRNFVVNSEIRDASRWVRTYRAGVFLWGVGHRVAHNLIHDLPHTAVFFWGNDHVLEFNEIHDVCLETGDAGAFYIGRDWTQRGHLIRHNYIHHLRRVRGGRGFTDVMGIYLDDWASGTTVRGNIFYRAGRSIMIGGGRDNLVENNLVIDGVPGLHVDARGIGWASSYFDGRNTVLFDRLKAVRPAKPPYSDRYPGLAAIPDDEPALPKGNRVVRNVFFGGRWSEFQDGVGRMGLVDLQANWTSRDPGFVDRRRGDYRLRPDAPVWLTGFERIPFEKIGPPVRAERRGGEPSPDRPVF